LLKTGKTLKSVKHNAAGSLVKGRVWKSHHFKNWRACWMHGLTS
jgi:hypothetical protein